MDVSDLKGLFGEVKKRMEAQIDHVRRELAGVRTGRASVNMLDTVHVEAYGSMMPLNQVASLSIPEPTLLLAAPFDPEKYEDTYQRRLGEMLEAKRHGRVIGETQTKKMAPVIDLMAALQRSLNQKAGLTNDAEEGEKKPARSAANASTRKRRAG